jgi:hypothetical protein
MQTTTLSGIQATQNVPAALTAIGGFVAPAGGATVSHLMVANTTASTTITVSVTVYNGTTDYYLAKNYSLSAGDTLNVLGESGSRLVLASGWSVRVIASLANDCDATMSVVTYS